jgi:hypothetical protein
LIARFQELVHIHELNKINGTIDVLSISKIKWHVRYVASSRDDNNYSFAFTKDGLIPSLKTSQSANWVLVAAIELHFVGNRDTYIVNIGASRDSKNLPLFANAVLRIDSLALVLTAIKLADGPNLVSVGSLWKKYFAQGWTRV